MTIRTKLPCKREGSAAPAGPFALSCPDGGPLFLREFPKTTTLLLTMRRDYTVPAYTSSTTELAEHEICGLYNSRGGCSYGAKCTKTHVCNYLVRGADGTQRLCGKKHTRFEHK